MNKSNPSAETQRLALATFAAGCFWGVEETFAKAAGVLDTEAGYAGGTTKNPTYEDVKTGTTGHAEAVRITFDPTKTSYESLLDIFWQSHDPTTPNRQGPDIGTQYRSIIFYHNPEQKRLAEESKKKLVDAGMSVVTEVLPADEFWRAEEYHQRYFEKNGGSSCSK